MVSIAKITLESQIMGPNSWASVLDQWENLLKTLGCVSRNESTHFSSCKPILPDSPNRAIISQVNQPLGGCASDPPIITHGHAFQIPNLDLKHMSARFSIATAQIPDPPGIVSGLHAFRPDAHDRYMSLGQILYIHSLAQSPTPKHCWLVISGNPTRQAIRMCQGLCIEFL